MATKEATGSKQATYQCITCGKTQQAPADKPAPHCCGQPMRKTSS